MKFFKTLECLKMYLMNLCSTTENYKQRILKSMTRRFKILCKVQNQKHLVNPYKNLINEQYQESVKTVCKTHAYIS